MSVGARAALANGLDNRPPSIGDTWSSMNGSAFGGATRYL